MSHGLLCGAWVLHSAPKRVLKVLCCHPCTQMHKLPYFQFCSRGPAVRSERYAVGHTYSGHGDFCTSGKRSVICSWAPCDLRLHIESILYHFVTIPSSMPGTSAKHASVECCPILQNTHFLILLETTICLIIIIHGVLRPKASIDYDRCPIVEGSRVILTSWSSLMHT